MPGEPRFMVLQYCSNTVCLEDNYAAAVPLALTSVATVYSACVCLWCAQALLP
jgi:hypothetical protein